MVAQRSFESRLRVLRDDFIQSLSVSLYSSVEPLGPIALSACQHRHSARGPALADPLQRDWGCGGRCRRSGGDVLHRAPTAENETTVPTK